MFIDHTIFLDNPEDFIRTFFSQAEEFAKRYRIDKGIYLYRKYEHWQLILVDLENDQGTLKGYGEILPKEVLKAALEFKDIDTLIEETALKVNYLEEILPSKYRLKHVKPIPELIISYVKDEILSTDVRLSYIQEPYIIFDYAKSSINKPIKFFGWLMEANGLEILISYLTPTDQDYKNNPIYIRKDGQQYYYVCVKSNERYKRQVIEHLYPDAVIDKLLEEQCVISKGYIDSFLFSLIDEEKISSYLDLIFNDLCYFDILFRDRLKNHSNLINRGVITLFILDLFEKYKRYLTASLAKYLREHLIKYSFEYRSSIGHADTNDPTVNAFHLKNFIKPELWDNFMTWIVLDAKLCDEKLRIERDDRRSHIFFITNNLLVENNYYSEKYDNKPGTQYKILINTFQFKTKLTRSYFDTLRGKKLLYNYQLPKK